MGSVMAYVKGGPKMEFIKREKIKLNFEIKTKKSVTESNSGELMKDEVLQTIEEECFAELKNVVAKNFPDLKSVYLALPIECFREIAQKLPQTKDEIMEIDQMTYFRFDKFGLHLLDVCKDYNTKRLNYLEDKQMAEIMAKEEDASTFSNPISSNPVYQSDSQRRSSWMSTKKVGSTRGGSNFRGRGGRGGGRGWKRGSFKGNYKGKKRAFPSENTNSSRSSGASSAPTSTTSKPPAKKPHFGPTPGETSQAHYLIKISWYARAFSFAFILFLLCFPFCDFSN